MWKMIGSWDAMLFSRFIHWSLAEGWSLGQELERLTLDPSSLFFLCFLAANG